MPKQAIDLVREYNKKNQLPTVVDSLNPLLSQVLQSLSLVLQKETVVNNEVHPAEVGDFKIDLENPVVVNVPEQPQPIVNIKSQNYTEALKALTKAVVELRKAVENRPKNYTVQRDRNGYIKEVNAK